MAVNELKSYTESKKCILKKHHFRDSKLVIDGCNLYHTVYFASHLDQEHGGEYEGFEKAVSCFFRNLRECAIKPYVVLSGEDEISDKTFGALKKRADIRIKKAHSLSRGCPRNVLPILIKTVFIQLLRKLKVPFIQCVAKADWEAAALANEWNCPVLSNNTDFYIYDIKGGFLPLYCFQWRNVMLTKRSDKKFIPAKLFSVEKLCGTFSCMNKQLLPILATILGINNTDLDRGMFPNWAEFSVSAEEIRYVDGLLKWLSGFEGPVEAICALMGCLTNSDDSATVIKALTEGLQVYSLAPSSIAKFFISEKPQSRLPGPLQSLPEWTLEPLAKGKLNSMITDVLAMQKIILNISVENFQLCSSNLTSQPIRQVIYGLLLCTRQKNGSGDDSPEAEVEEYDREGLKLTSSRVAAVLPSLTIPDLHLDTLWETSWHLRLRIFLDTLGVLQVPERLLVLPSLQLAVYVTCYWLKHAQPEPKPEFFWALLVGLVYGELSRDPLTEKELPKRLRNLKSRKEETPLDLEAAHAYSQWQGSLRDSICLNQLLNNPVPEPEYARLYSGVLVHGVTRELKRGITTESLLARAPCARQLYQQLREAVELELDDDMKTRLRAGRERPSDSPAGKKCADDLSTMFEHLMDKEEEDDEDPRGRRKKSEGSKHEDEMYEQTCSIRTRHRSRSHKTNPRSKKYENSCWE
ncbi:protein asteroid homolog 1-like [Colossoma macropomum]|uniref:protein asteroid homolog 1-like n=1 Tax=Colossoma macropomum TaxID=42526 RepID=UPI0018648D5F|nr:protein asteroid homolog 1-like [Colossoma macropomum]